MSVLEYVAAHGVKPTAARFGWSRQPLLELTGRLTMYVGASGTRNRIELLHNALGAIGIQSPLITGGSLRFRESGIFRGTRRSERAIPPRCLARH